nr:hypothetical protein [Tanacetum cinerariifolium]
DDILFSTIKVVSRYQNTKQYGAILPIELTTEDIRNTKAYKEYYACATREAAPKPKASARRKRGGYASSTTPPTPIATPTPITTVVAAPRLIVAAKGKQPARATSPADPLDNSSDDEDVDDQTKGSDEKEGEKTDESYDDDDDQDEAKKVNDDDDDEEEISKIDEQEATESESDDDGNGEEDQGLRISEEEMMHEEEEADELYRDVDINQGRGLQVSQDIDDSHVTLTLVHFDGQQESSSTSSFVTSLLNPIVDPGMESIFTTASTSVTPLPSPTSTVTSSIITTTRTASRPPIPPTPIPREVLQNLPTFESVFRFEDRVKSLEVNLSEFMRTNQFLEAVSTISDKTILDSYGESAILKRRRKDDDDQEGSFAGSDRGSKRWREEEPVQTTYQIKEPHIRCLKQIQEPLNYGKHALWGVSYWGGNVSSSIDQGSKRQREEGEHASATTPSEPAIGSAGRTTTWSQSRQLSASESAFAEEPVQPTCQMEEPSHLVFEI